MSVRTSRELPWTRILLFNFAFLGLGLVALELIFGGWVKKSRLDQLTIVRDASYTYELKDLYPSPDPLIHYSRDRFGFRGSYPDPNRIDILTIGGSTTDQRYISDGQTWQDVIARELSVRMGRPVHVANAGIDGRSTFGHLKDFDLWFPEIPGLNPRFYLFFIGINDLFAEQARNWDQLGYEKGSWLQRLAANSALVRVYRMLQGHLAATKVFELGHAKTDFSRIDWTDRPLQSDHETLMREKLAGLKSRMRVLMDASLGRGGRPVFVTQSMRSYRWNAGRLEGIPRKLQWRGLLINGVDEALLMKAMNRAIIENCRSEVRAICIDFGSEVTLDEGDTYDLMHFTPQGAQKVGNFIAKALGDLR